MLAISPSLSVKRFQRRCERGVASALHRLVKELTKGSTVKLNPKVQFFREFKFRHTQIISVLLTNTSAESLVREPYVVHVAMKLVSFGSEIISLDISCS